MSQVKVDVLIKNGRVIDPARGIDEVGAVAVRDGRIVEPPDGAAQGVAEYDASGCLVIPGMVDFHTHFFHQGTFTGLNADLAFLPSGVTAAVDQGSTGIAACRAFMDNLVRNTVKSRLFLHVSAPGQSSVSYHPEPYLPEKWNRSAFRAAMDYMPGRVVGIKMRASKNAVLSAGANAFFESVRLAEDLDTRLVVHINDPPMLQSELAVALRPGDVMAHVFHGVGNTIYENGNLAPEIWKAKERGVLFDAAHGGENISYNVAARALEDGFLPDIISSDLTLSNWLMPQTHSLPYVMSQFLALGMDIGEIIRCVTCNPARAAGIENMAGTLALGMPADIAILKLKEQPVIFRNSFGEACQGKALFVPQAVFADGRLVHLPLDSAVLR